MVLSSLLRKRKAASTPLPPSPSILPILLKILNIYPIATQLVRNLRRTELLNLCLAHHSISTLLWTPLNPAPSSSPSDEQCNSTASIAGSDPSIMPIHHNNCVCGADECRRPGETLAPATIPSLDPPPPVPVQEKTPECYWYWQLLSRVCKSCYCTTPMSESRQKCWGCSQFTCAGCQLTLFLILPHLPGSRWVFPPGSYYPSLDASIRAGRKKNVYYKANGWRVPLVGGFPRLGWGSFILSCEECFRRLPREGHGVRGEEELMVDFPVQEMWKVGVRVVRLRLGEVEVLRAVWKRLPERVLEGGEMGELVYSAGGRFRKRVSVWGERLEWIMECEGRRDMWWMEWVKPSYLGGDVTDQDNV